MNVNTKKDFSISFARLTAMIFIVVCHFLQYYGKELAWWFNVGVQMFFCISGFLYGGRKIDSSTEFMYKNLKKILIPYYCFLIPIIIIYLLFKREMISASSVVMAFLCSGTIKGIENLWFVSYILFCYLITPYLYDITKCIRKYSLMSVMTMFCLFVILGQALFYTFNVYFMFSRIVCYIAGYFIAFLMNEYGLKCIKRIAAVVISAGAGVNIFRIYMKYFTEKNIPYFEYIEQYGHALLGISLFLIIYICCRNIKNNRIFDLSDKYSYYVYIVHQLFILSPFGLMTATSNLYLNWILVLVAIVVSAFVLKIVSDKANALTGKVEMKICNRIGTGQFL